MKSLPTAIAFPNVSLMPQVLHRGPISPFGAWARVMCSCGIVLPVIRVRVVESLKLSLVRITMWFFPIVVIRTNSANPVRLHMIQKPRDLDPSNVLQGQVWQMDPLLHPWLRQPRDAP